MLHGMGLCPGIGGAELALSEWVEPVCFVEIAEYPQEVLRKNFPRVPIWDDLRTFDGKPWRGRVDLIAAGFPCQDISAANPNGKGLDGERSGLFFEVVRVIREVRPYFVFLENSPRLRKYMGTVASELAELGYECRWMPVSAAEVGAWHLRKRLFVVAADIDRVRGRVQQGRRGGESRERSAIDHGDGQDGHSHSKSPKEIRQVCRGSDAEPPGADWWLDEPDVGRVVHGLSTRLDKRIRAERIKALGNCMVPAQAKEAFKRLMGLT